jgi:tRNA modification GTPase
LLSGEIIAAWATPPGLSALAVIRLSGDGCARLAERLMGLRKGRLGGGMRRAVGEVRRSGRVVDEVVAFSWPQKASYTGEEMVELSCHGIPERVREVLEMAFEMGARQAEPGEFTRRGFLDGRISALDVLALAAMTRGKGSGNAKAGIRGRCLQLRDSLRRAIEILEGELEFAEAHGLEQSGEGLGKLGAVLLRGAEDLIEAAVRMEEPCRVLFMGPRNAGKSTLVNLLAGHRVALTSEEPGTTRDGVAVRVEIEGRPVELRDSAGAGADGLEAEAFEMVLADVGDRDLVVWMTENGNPEPPARVAGVAARVISVLSKADTHRRETGGMRVSSVTGEGTEELRRMISEAGQAPVSACARRVSGIVAAGLKTLEDGDYPLAAEMLREAERTLSGMVDGSGQGMAEAVQRALDNLCVGK